MRQGEKIMRNVLGIIAGSVIALSAGAAAAAEIKVVTVGATRPALENIAANYSMASRNTVAFTFTNPANINMVLAEGTFDVIVAATSTVSELAAAGRLVPGSQRRVARTGIGVSVREGAPRPDLSTSEAFRNTLLAARGIALTNAMVPNGSGVLVEQILTNTGILDQVKAKGQVLGLAMGKEAIARGEIELGLFNISEATAPGVVLAGPVPQALQLYTNYDAGVFANTVARAEADAFIRFMSQRAITANWSSAGLELTTQ